MTNTDFPVDQAYSSVCGRVLAIQKGTPDGFGPTFYDSNPDALFDGVAISQGSSYSIGHSIWSFVAAPSEFPDNQDAGCPCAYIVNGIRLLYPLSCVQIISVSLEILQH